MAGSNKAEPPVFNEPIANSGASPGATATVFHYDALDTLIGRTTSAGKEQRFYRNDELATEVQGAASSSFVRAGGIVLAEHRSGAGIQSLLLAGNDKNSVLCEVSQEAIRGIAYSPYGHRVAGSPVNSHLGYNGERRETQTGWYLLGKGYRVFNPLLMRFHSPDNLSPFGKGGLNAYMYCMGDPINSVDPTGHSVFGFFSRGFRGLFGSNRLTTATPGAQNLPPVLRLNPHEKTRPTSLRPIRIKDVNNLERRADLQLELATKFKSKDSEKYYRYMGFYEDDFEAFNFAKEHQGQKLITKYGQAAAKKSAKKMAELEKEQAQEKRAVFLDWQANQILRDKAYRRPQGEEKSYLGVNNMDRIQRDIRS
jgi:RHS repeat-associated protein